jgi:hypothetical protein
MTQSGHYDLRGNERPPRSGLSAALEQKGVSSKFVIISLGTIDGLSVNYRSLAKFSRMDD